MSAEERRWPDLAGRLDGRRHILPVRVYYEDTDFSGLVYHASYLRFLERGRTDMIRLLGVHHTALMDGEAGNDSAAFVVRRMEIDFLRPARMDDILEVITEAEEMTAATLTLGQKIMRGEETLISSRAKIVLISSAGKPQRLRSLLPSDVCDFFASPSQ